VLSAHCSKKSIFLVGNQILITTCHFISEDAPIMLATTMRSLLFLCSCDMFVPVPADESEHFVTLS
ncbi:MAG: hypothetical protein UV60_C0032G0001, partial [Parcubacteria group bacterium GW2011_GWA2_43_11]